MQSQIAGNLVIVKITPLFLYPGFGANQPRVCESAELAGLCIVLISSLLAPNDKFLNSSCLLFCLILKISICLFERAQGTQGTLCPRLPCYTCRHYPSSSNRATALAMLDVVTPTCRAIEIFNGCQFFFNLGNNVPQNASKTSVPLLFPTSA